MQEPLEDSRIKNYVIEALSSTGGEFLIKGAALGLIVRALASKDNFDFQDYLKSTKLTFMGLMLHVAATGAIQVLPQNVGDFLVGLPTAIAPKNQAQPFELRPDVFSAFTRINTKYYYHPNSDEFTTMSTSECIEVEPVSPDIAVNMRREFAMSMPEEIRHELLSTLLEVDDSNNSALSTFKLFSREVVRQHLSAKWGWYRSQFLAQHIRQWADKNNVPFHKEWLPPVQRHQSRIRSNGGELARALERLSDDDLSKIVVPLSVVQRMLQKHHP